MTATTRLLVRLYCRRFLENDLLAPSGENQVNTAVVLALLMAPGFFNLAWLLFAYAGPFTTPSERLLLGLDHKYQFLACSMIVTALGAALQWDALSIDARDRAILGPLPISEGALWRAKILSLVVYLAVFAAAINLIPALGFPIVWLSLLPIGFARAASVVAVHAATSAAAAVVGFAVVVSIRSFLLVACGPRRFRSVSAPVQFSLVLALITFFLLMPGYSTNLRDRLREPSARIAYSPPMWFVGAYDRLTSRALYADPDMTRNSTWRFWERERLGRTYPLVMIPGRLPEAWVHPSPLFKTEVEARAKYQALEPVLDRLAGTALVALLLALVAATSLYAIAYRLHGRRMSEALAVGPPPARPLGRLARLAAARIAVRRPLERATFFFTLQVLARSGPHRTCVAGFAGVGCAIAIGLFAHRPGTPPGMFSLPTPALLALQFVLAFFLVLGVRASLALPASLPAGWIFRTTDCGHAARPLAGVRRALGLGVVLPLLICLLPIHAWLWGGGVAARHLAAGLVLSLLVVEVLLIGFRKLPFTCPRTGNGDLRVRWPFYCLGFMAVTWGVGALEHAALGSTHGFAAFLLVAGLMLGCAATGRRMWLSRNPRLVFDEEPDPAVQTLGLTT